jgi:hypothetical protein
MGGAGDIGGVGNANSEQALGVNGVADTAGAEQAYSLRGIYFNKERFSSVADCLTAASLRHLPLGVCD